MGFCMYFPEVIRTISTIENVVFWFIAGAHILLLVYSPKHRETPSEHPLNIRAELEKKEYQQGGEWQWHSYHVHALFMYVVII